MSYSLQPLKRLAAVSISNVDKQSVDGDIPVRLVNYTDVYYGDRLTPDLPFMQATATRMQLRTFRLRAGDVVFTKDSETPEDIASPAFVQDSADDLVLGYHLAMARSRRESVEPRYLYWAMRAAFTKEQLSAGATGVTRYGLREDVIKSVRIPVPSFQRQRAIAEFLDTEASRIDALIAKKRGVMRLIEERIDSEVFQLVGSSELASEGGSPVVPLRRLLEKREHWTYADGEMITAFRDGEVTRRSVRRREGYMNAWSTECRLQIVDAGNVVVHGLDGFAGAIGDARFAGVCSPVYHVCSPRDGGDSAFYGRLLRLLALNGYLGNFATSTRERAVDFRNWDLFGRIPIPVVPLAVQRRMGDRIRDLRPLHDKIRLSEALACEHRLALITAAVSGELDIGGAAA